MKNQFLAKWVGDTFYVDGKPVGWKTGNTCGRFAADNGECGGIFAYATETTPITEWADKHGIELFWERTLEPVPRCF